MNFFEEYNQQKQESIRVQRSIIRRIRFRVFPSKHHISRSLVISGATAVLALVFIIVPFVQHRNSPLIDPKIALADSLDAMFIPDDELIVKFRQLRVEQNSFQQGKIYRDSEKEIYFWGYGLQNMRTDIIKEGKLYSRLFSKQNQQYCVSSETGHTNTVACRSFKKFLHDVTFSVYGSMLYKPTEKIDMTVEPEYFTNKNGVQKPWSLHVTTSTNTPIDTMKFFQTTSDFKTLSSGDIIKNATDSPYSLDLQYGRTVNQTEDGMYSNTFAVSTLADDDVYFQLQLDGEYSQIVYYNFDTQELQFLNDLPQQLPRDVAQTATLQSLYNRELAPAWFAMEHLSELEEPIMVEIEQHNDEEIYHIQFSVDDINQLKESLGEKDSIDIGTQLILDFRFIPEQHKILEYSLKTVDGAIWRRVTIEKDEIVTDIDPENFFTREYWENDLEAQTQKRIRK